MKTLMALSFFLFLLIIVYIIKKSICAKNPIDDADSQYLIDLEILDKIEPLELQLIQKEKERDLLFQKYCQVYEDLGIDAAYAELHEKFETGQIDKASYQEQLDIFLSKIDLKEMDLDLF